MCHYHMAFQTPSPPGSGPRLPDPRPVSPEYHSRMGSTLWRAEKVELVFSPPVMVRSWRASSWSLAWLSIQAPVSTSPDILAQRGRRMTDHGVCFYIQSWWGHPRADPVLLCELESHREAAGNTSAWVWLRSWWGQRKGVKAEISAIGYLLNFFFLQGIHLKVSEDLFLSPFFSPLSSSYC